AFGADRVVIYGRDEEPGSAKLLASAQTERARADLPPTITIAQTWLDEAFGGAMVMRAQISSDPRDGLLRTLGAGSGLIVPLVIEGRVEHALMLHFGAPNAFDEIDALLL